MAPQKPPKVSTSDFLIVFGPSNTYLARAPTISRSTLLLSPDLDTKIQGSKGINFVIFPPKEPNPTRAGAEDELGNDNPNQDVEDQDEDERADPDDIEQGYADPRDPYLSYSKKGHMGDSKLFVPSEDYLPTLTKWLKDRWGTGGLQVVGNGQGAWWGLSSSGSTQWTTDHLARDVRQLLKPYNPHGKVVHLALGVKGCYVVLFEDGHVDWDLHGYYNKLDAELAARTQGELVYVSLSAYTHRHFFAAFSNATVLYNFPKDADELDEDFLAVDTLRVIVPSDTVKHTANPVKKAPGATSSLLTGMAKDVTEKVIENAI